MNIKANSQSDSVATELQPIGIFDSGIGGISVLNAIHQILPNENLLYVADSQYAPYGTKTDQVIGERVEAIAAFLAHKNVKAMVVACNTATAAAIESIRQTYNIPIIGLEPAIKPAVENSQTKQVGVLATQLTLQSKKYQTLRARFTDQVSIFEKASPLFVELVETNHRNLATKQEVIRQELEFLKHTEVDCLVLGCTHYPFLSELIQPIIGNHVRLFESGTPVAMELKRRLGEKLNQQANKGSVTYYSSAPEKTQPMLNLLLNKEIAIQPM